MPTCPGLIGFQIDEVLCRHRSLRLRSRSIEVLIFLCFLVAVSRGVGQPVASQSNLKKGRETRSNKEADILNIHSSGEMIREQ